MATWLALLVEQVTLRVSGFIHWAVNGFYLYFSGFIIDACGMKENWWQHRDLCLCRTQLNDILELRSHSFVTWCMLYTVRCVHLVERLIVNINVHMCRKAVQQYHCMSVFDIVLNHQQCNVKWWLVRDRLGLAVSLLEDSFTHNGLGLLPFSTLN